MFRQVSMRNMVSVVAAEELLKFQVLNFSRSGVEFWMRAHHQREGSKLLAFLVLIPEALTFEPSKSIPRLCCGIMASVVATVKGCDTRTRSDHVGTLKIPAAQKGTVCSPNGRPDPFETRGCDHNQSPFGVIVPKFCFAPAGPSCSIVAWVPSPNRKCGFSNEHDMLRPRLV